MADLKRLAMGRKAFAKPAASENKPEKTLEESCNEELTEIETSFRDRLAKEDRRKQVATDTEFWFAVYFQTREEKERFLREYGLDKIGDKYLAGKAVDRMLKRRSISRPRDGHRDRRG